MFSGWLGGLDYFLVLVLVFWSGIAWERERRI